MGLGWLLEAAGGPVWPALPWLGPLELIAATLVLCGTALLAVALARARRRHRRDAAAKAERLLVEAQGLKQQLRLRLDEPDLLLVNSPHGGPIMGASAAFESDIEAAAAVVAEADGRRVKARELLRKRLNGGAASGDGSGLNGSAITYWRQLGALTLLDNLDDAATAYARAADLAPGDAEAQMLAGVLHLRAGSLSAAEAAFRRQLDLSSGEACGIARYRAHTMLGDVHAARADHAGALAAYREAQREAQALIVRNGTDCGLQRDLSVTCDRIGDVEAASGRLEDALDTYRRGLEIVEALAAREPHNPVWLRDLSVSHDRIGDILERMSDIEGALQSYRQGLAFAQGLVLRDPSNAGWQWDLSVSHERVGDMLIAKGRLDEALESYRRGLAIAERLAARDPANIAWQRDLAVSYHKIGSLEAVRHDVEEARDLLEKGRAIIARLERIAALRAQWRSDLAKFDRTLKSLQG